MFLVGDIVHFYSATADKKKYHLCFNFHELNELYSFIFLNSDGEFEDHFVCECSRINGMPESKTGKTVISCPTVFRKTEEQLKMLKARKITELPPDVASELLVFARGIKSMIANDKNNLIRAMQSIVDAANTTSSFD